jgi:3-oxoisoapionate decarboxylase
MKAGISSYTYTWAVGVPGSEPTHPLSAFDLVDKAGELNVSVLQIADNLPLYSLKPSDLEKLAEYAKSKGVAIEVGARGLTSESLKEYINIAGILKSPILRFVIDGSGYEPDVDTVLELIRQHLPELEKVNIALVMENHDRLHSSTFKQIIESINHPLLGICLDSVNSLGIAEGLETVVDNLAPYTLNLHVKDFTIRRVDHKMGFVVEGVPAGKGFLNLSWILEKLKPWNRCHSAILELWTPPAASIEETIKKEDAWARESVEYLKQII